jgi:hypothetical protein
LDPLDCSPDNPMGLTPAAEFNIKWLTHELGTRGILNYW